MEEVFILGKKDANGGFQVLGLYGTFDEALDGIIEDGGDINDVTDDTYEITHHYVEDSGFKLDGDF